MQADARTFRDYPLLWFRANDVELIVADFIIMLIDCILLQ